MVLPYYTDAMPFGVRSAMQDKAWFFPTMAERDSKAAELRQDGFECRHGVYLMTPEEYIPSAFKRTPFYQKNGNHWAECYQ